LAAIAADVNFTQLDRSPVDLAISTRDLWVATANQTSNSVSLIRLGTGGSPAKWLDEAIVGEHPSAIIVHPKSDQILVTSSYSGELYFLTVENDRLRFDTKLFLGFQPNGLAISPDGESIYVALTDADQIAVIDFASRSLRRKINVGRWPRSIAVSINSGN
jgi:YVTN family beta-propeller protein